MEEIGLFLILLSVSLSIFYGMLLKIRSQKNIIPKLLISLLVPVFGIILLVIIDIIEHSKVLNKIEKNINMDSEFMLISSQKNDDFSNSRNYNQIIPLINALEISDIQLKREVIFRSVNGKLEKIFPLLQKALKDDDFEVVHYASASISDFRQIVNIKINNCSNKYKESPMDKEVCIEYANALIDYINLAKFSQEVLTPNRIVLGQVLNSLFEIDPEIDSKYLTIKFNNEIELANKNSALKTIMIFYKRFLYEEPTLMAILKFGYKFKKIKLIEKVLFKMSKTDMSLSREALEILRFWDEQLASYKGAEICASAL